VDRRLVPLNGVLDLATTDGLNSAPLAVDGWRVVGLEIPVRTEHGTVVLDLVLFNDRIGHILGVESKSGANIESEQGRRLTAVAPQMVVDAAAITIRTAVTLQYEPMYVCLGDHMVRVAQGLKAARLSLPLLVVHNDNIRLHDPAVASTELAGVLGESVALTHPIASVIPFDHESSDASFDSPVRAELVAAMAQGRQSVSVRSLTEAVVWHYNMYGQRARGLLVRKVSAAAVRAADAEPTRLRFERRTGSTEDRVVILQSPEGFDRRGRTQSYQAVFGGRSSRRRPPAVSPDQFDLFDELDQAEMAIGEFRNEVDSDGEGGVEDDSLESRLLAPPAPSAMHSDTGESPREETS
jgi:hypothetical protein